MVLRLQFSGYTQKFRHEVVNAALKAYDVIKDKVSRGERPLYRPYEWMRDERDAMKKEKALGWYKRGGYKSVIFDTKFSATTSLPSRDRSSGH